MAVGELEKLACDPTRDVQKSEVGQLLVLSPHVRDQRSQHPESQLWRRPQCRLEVVLGEHDAACRFDCNRARRTNTRRVEHPKLAKGIPSAEEPKHELSTVARRVRHPDETALDDEERDRRFATYCQGGDRGKG